MKISINWLKDYVQADVSSEKLAYKLTMAGLEVEKISSFEGDRIFELEITPNRADCLSFLGIAREVSAVLNTSLKQIRGKKITIPKNKISVRIEDKQGCSRYIGALVENVRIAKAPAGIQKRLSLIGVSTVNNAVDITNFCLMETGQPLHAFDYDKLIGGKIVVRRAKKGERLIAIDGNEYLLDPSVLVIADEERPVAIAGIMGGKETEVTEETKNILLESACFDPALIRASVRSLGLASDSSYRFERGVDRQMVEGGALRALSLIGEHAGGTLSAFNDVAAVKKKVPAPSIHVPIEQLEKLLGTSVGLSQCQTILKKLGFHVVKIKKNMLKVSPPSFRSNIYDPVDIVEEVARIIGYDNISPSFPIIRVSDIKKDGKKSVADRVRETVLAQGFNEAVTYAMISRDGLKKTGQELLKTIKVKNPLSLDQEVMRPSLAPSLLSVMVTNINRGEKNVKLFELGKIYAQDGEKEVLGLIATGQCYQDWRRLEKSEIDFYDLKGVLEIVLEQNGVKDHCFMPSGNSLFRKGQSAALKVEQREVAVLGRLANNVLRNWDIKQKQVWFAEMDLEWLSTEGRLHKQYQDIAGFPAVIRDVSLAIKEKVTFRQVRDIVDELKPDFLSEMKFNEEYRGEKIPAGYKGIVFSLVYQSFSRTLRENEVDAAHEKICQAITDRLGAIKR